MSEYKIKEHDNVKVLRSENYNYNFDKNSGFFMRWGKTPQEDPDWCEFGPEIADIEISTVCNGIEGKPCKFCYKSNTGTGENMSLETFHQILKRLPDTVCQIAFGIGDIHANPDLYSIIEMTRSHGIIPNITVNGWNLSGVDYHMLSKLCGAVAVSRYNPPAVCYDAVSQLSKKGMDQVNIHQLLCKETYKSCFRVMNDAKKHKQLKNRLNSIVFLALKQCGRGTKLTPISKNEYYEIVYYALKNSVRIGFDSCSAPLFMWAIEQIMINHPDLMPPDKFKLFTAMAEPCESTLFSVYIDVHGMMYPCSFCESKFEGINVLDYNDFSGIWHNDHVARWRRNLLATSKAGLVPGCRECPEYFVWRDD